MNSSPLPGVTLTVSVTDWPACNVPCWLVSATSADDVSADQLTGPFMAVRVSWPVVLGPRSSRSGVTARVPFALGALLEADAEADVAADPAGLPAWLGSGGMPGCEAAATASDSVLEATDCLRGPVEDGAPDDRLTLTGRAASAPPPG